MRLVFFIVLFFARVACAVPIVETSKIIPVLETLPTPANSNETSLAPQTLPIRPSGEERAPILKPLPSLRGTVETCLVFVLSSLGILFFIASQQSRDARREGFLALACSFGALLCFPGSRTLLPFYFGESIRLALPLRQQLETCFSIGILLALYYFVNEAYQLRIRRRILFGHLLINSGLIALTPFVPLVWIHLAIGLQCIPFIVIHLFLFRGKKARISLAASGLVLMAGLFDELHPYASVPWPTAALSPYFMVLLALSRISQLKPLFATPKTEALETQGIMVENETRDDLDSTDDLAITLEIQKRPLETFSVFMNSLHNALFQMTYSVQKNLSRQDDPLKLLYIQSKTIEEGARLLGYTILSQKIARLTETLVRLLQNLDAHWNPLAIGKEIEGVRKAGQQYLRLNSKIVGRRLEYVSKTSHDKELNNFKKEDPQFISPELKRAAGMAQRSFQQVAWLKLDTTLQSLALHSLRDRTIPSEAELHVEALAECSYAFNYDDLVDLRQMLDLIVDNAVKHGFENSYERILKGKETPSQITLTLRRNMEGVVVRIQDDGKGLGILRLREWAHEDRLLDKGRDYDLLYYAKLLLVKEWRAPRGLTRVVELAEKMGARIDLVLFPERIQQGHCPFAVDIMIPAKRLRQLASVTEISGATAAESFEYKRAK